MVQANFKTIEKKWQKRWEQKKIFQVKENKKKKFYVLEQFPYPSGSGLHIGHSFVYTIGDIYARFKRMQGFNVLHPIGYDALGLPAENAAIKVGQHPKDYTKKSTAYFTKQMKKLGFSYDWSRVINTTEPDYYKWDQWIFLKMLEKGLAYKKKGAVNWCPKCKTVLANEQVHNGKCEYHENVNVEIKHLEQWYFKITDYANELYDKIDTLDGWPNLIKKLQKNWIGKSYGTEIDFKIVSGTKFQDSSSKRERNDEKWQIFTTRPDTIFGVTFMVISIQHPKLMELVTKEQKKDVEKFLKKLKSVSEKELEDLEKEGVFTGAYAVNPMTKEKIPVYAGNFVVADYGSGMVMAVPAHDQRDFEFAKKYNIPIKQVVKPKISKSIVLGPSVKKDFEKELEINSIKFEIHKSKNDRKHIGVILEENQIDKYLGILKKSLKKNWWVEIVGSRNILIFNGDIIEDFFDNEKEVFEKCKKVEPLIKDYKNMWEMLDDNSFYHGFICYTGEGKLVNSGKFNGMDSKKAIEEITNYLQKNKLGRKKIQYKLRDWLVSRQRYWGTPIPIVYCDKCGIVPVPEKDLPVKLPDKVVFGKGNPLTTNEKWIKTKCPKCKGKARRETDTMDTFVNSSWYFLRYCDPKNNKQIFDKKKVEYWVPVDLYVGGKEHACMHDIYMRFYVKFLRDLKLLKIDEPAIRLFVQGIVHGEDGNKMSKSLGNTIDPMDIINKYGADSLRMFLVSVASLDSDFNWSDKEIQGSLKFINKVIGNKLKFGKSSKRVESKVNKTIKEVSENIENFKYNLAIIKLRSLFDVFAEEGEVSKKDFEDFLKLLHPFCPHITEEFWSKLGNKTFISLAKWPISDEKKIDESFEKQDEMISKLKNDINQIMKLTGKKNPKIYVYVLPKEFEIYKEIPDVKVFSVTDKNKYDPENKSKKVRPRRPGIYLE